MSEEVERAIALAECEAIINRGRPTFVEVGKALIRIREQRLYCDEGFGTFRDYCNSDSDSRTPAHVSLRELVKPLRR